jgi:hypothetical protein
MSDVRNLIASGRVRWTVAASAVVLATACTAVPDSGGVHAGNPVAPSPTAKVNVQARAPVTNDVPQNIVLGFQFANTDSSLGVPKAYLADGASWQPHGVAVVGDSSTVSPPATNGDSSTVKVVYSQVGAIAADGTYQPSPDGQPLPYEYTLSRSGAEKGQWRITNPPPFLVLTVNQIESTYQKGYVYFLRPDEQMLVPVRVFLPVRGNFADELLATLLHGPPAWLKSAVTTAIPARTAPMQPSSEVGGVTTVELSREIATASDAERNAIAAQIAYTLANVDTPSQYFGQLRILAGGQPFLGCKGLALETAKDCTGFDGDALRFNFYFTDLEHRSRDHLDHLLPGDTGTFGITSLQAASLVPRVGASGTPDLIAGVTLGTGTDLDLYAGPVAQPKKLLQGTAFTTPSWDSLGNLWTVQQANSLSAPQVRVAPTGQSTLPAPVALPPILANNNVIRELKVSRDGTRIGVLAVSKNGSQVMVGSVNKDGTIANFYPVAPSLTTARDFVWASSTRLEILSTAPSNTAAGTTSQLWTVDVDGWLPSLADKLILPDATALIADAPGGSVVVGTTSNVIEKLTNNTWEIVGDGTSPRYPG